MMKPLVAGDTDGAFLNFHSPTANIEVACHSDGATNGSGEESPRRRAQCYPFEGEAERMFGRGGSEPRRGDPAGQYYNRRLSRKRFKRSTPQGALKK